MRYTTVLLSVTLALVGSSSFLATIARAEELTDEQMQACWDDLLKSDPDATRALLKMSSSPAKAVEFMQSRLQPLKVDAEQVNKWIKDLESDDDEVWKPAFEKLDYFDPRLAIPLATLMADVSNPKSRPRLVELMSGRAAGAFAGKDVKYREFPDGANFSVDDASFWAEKDVSRIGILEPKPQWARATRAVLLLEHIGSPEAIKLLKDMATGNPAAVPTNVAATALEKLDGKK